MLKLEKIKLEYVFQQRVETIRTRSPRRGLCKLAEKSDRKRSRNLSPIYYYFQRKELN